MNQFSQSTLSSYKCIVCRRSPKSLGRNRLAAFVDTVDSVIRDLLCLSETACIEEVVLLLGQTAQNPLWCMNIHFGTNSNDIESIFKLPASVSRVFQFCSSLHPTSNEQNEDKMTSYCTVSNASSPNCFCASNAVREQSIDVPNLVRAVHREFVTSAPLLFQHRNRYPQSKLHIQVKTRPKHSHHHPVSVFPWTNDRSSEVDDTPWHPLSVPFLPAPFSADQRALRSLQSDLQERKRRREEDSMELLETANDESVGMNLVRGKVKSESVQYGFRIVEEEGKSSHGITGIPFESIWKRKKYPFIRLNVVSTSHETLVTGSCKACAASPSLKNSCSDQPMNKSSVWLKYRHPIRGFQDKLPPLPFEEFLRKQRLRLNKRQCNLRGHSENVERSVSHRPITIATDSLRALCLSPRGADYQGEFGGLSMGNTPGDKENYPNRMPSSNMLTANCVEFRDFASLIPSAEIQISLDNSINRSLEDSEIEEDQSYRISFDF